MSKKSMKFPKGVKVYFFRVDVNKGCLDYSPTYYATKGGEYWISETIQGVLNLVGKQDGLCGPIWFLDFPQSYRQIIR